MHDIQIENRLRDVLRAEADAQRVTLTGADLAAALADRRRRRSSQRTGLAAAAVVALLVVAAGSILLANRGDGPPVGSPASSTREPESVARLHALAGTELPIVLTGERRGDTGSVPDVLREYEVGTVDGGDRFHQVVHSCVGSGPFELHWSAPAGPAPIRPWRYETCTGEPTALLVGTLPPASRLVVRTSPGVSWRLIVVMDPTTASPSPAAGLAPIVPTFGTVVLDEERAADASVSGRQEAAFGGIPLAARYHITVRCIGDGTFAFAFGGPIGGGFVRSEDACTEGHSQGYGLGPGVVSGVVGPLTTTVAWDPGVAWHLVVESVDPAGPAIPATMVAQIAPDGPATGALPGCVGSWESADGDGGDATCQGPAWPAMGDQAVLNIEPGGEIAFRVEDGWRMLGASVRAADWSDVVATNGEPATVYEIADVDGSTTEAVIAIAQEGDLVVRLSSTFEKDGDRYTVGYFVRVRVAP